MFVYDFVVYPPPHSPGRGRTWQELDFWLRIDSRVELIDRLQCSCLVSINIAQYIQLSRWPRGNRRNAVDTDRVTTFLAPSLKMVWVGWGGVGHSIYWKPWKASKNKWNTSTIKNFRFSTSSFCFGVIFWNYKPPRGAAGDETLALWKPRCLVLKSVRLIVFPFLFVHATSILCSSALTLWGGSGRNSPVENVIWLVTIHSTLLGPPPPAFRWK